MTSLRPAEGGGFIVRTVCEGLSKREIQADITFLTRQWQRITQKSESAPAPAMLYHDMDLVQRTIRDLFTPEVGHVWVDSPHEHQRMLDLVETLAPRLKGRLALYEGAEPIFDHFGIEAQIDKALDRKVWLKSGGTLVIDRTEALTSVDVNTGRYVGKKNQDETILRTNLEAAEEVVRQLRLRNIGGLIIIDFIDMENPDDRQRVSDVLQEAVRQKDKAQTRILKISELGLVEMTRKRARESLQQLLCSPCPHCDGTGHAKSAETISFEILRKVERGGAFPAGSSRLVVKASPAVAAFLSDSESRALDQLEKTIAKRIIIKAQEGFRTTQYEIVHSERSPTRSGNRCRRVVNHQLAALLGAGAHEDAAVFPPHLGDDRLTGIDDPDESRFEILEASRIVPQNPARIARPTYPNVQSPWRIGVLKPPMLAKAGSAWSGFRSPERRKEPARAAFSFPSLDRACDPAPHGAPSTVRVRRRNRRHLAQTRRKRS